MRIKRMVYIIRGMMKSFRVGDGLALRAIACRNVVFIYSIEYMYSVLLI